MCNRKLKAFFVKNWARFFESGCKAGYKADVAVSRQDGIDVYTSHKFEVSEKIQKIMQRPMRIHDEIGYEELQEIFNQEDVLNISLDVDIEEYTIQYVVYKDQIDSSNGLDAVICIYEDQYECELAFKFLAEVDAKL